MRRGGPPRELCQRESVGRWGGIPYNYCVMSVRSSIKGIQLFASHEYIVACISQKDCAELGVRKGL